MITGSNIICIIVTEISFSRRSEINSKPVHSSVGDLKIVADANLVLLEDTFGKHGTITRIPGREIRNDHVRNADVLLLRSVTWANEGLLEGSRVTFVGTATIGTDHLDIPYLANRGIKWASAPGCNADAASQYTLAMMWLACERLGRDIRNESVGIIGHGNVGTRLHRLLDVLEIPSVACDPPLARQGTEGLVSMQEVLAQPIVSVHVPLTVSGPFPTWHMINSTILQQMQGGALLVNTSRGDVTNGDALLAALKHGDIHAALDVWPGEPELDRNLLAATTASSPHVAGYSIEGKRSGSLMIYRAFRNWLELQDDWNPPDQEKPLETVLDPNHDPVGRMLELCCGVGSDDLALRQSSSNFDGLRKNYRLRRDFSGWKISAAAAGGQARTLLDHLGFQ